MSSPHTHRHYSSIEACHLGKSSAGRQGVKPRLDSQGYVKFATAGPRPFRFKSISLLHIDCILLAHSLAQGLPEPLRGPADSCCSFRLMYMAASCNIKSSGTTCSLYKCTSHLIVTERFHQEDLPHSSSCHEDFHPADQLAVFL